MISWRRANLQPAPDCGAATTSTSNRRQQWRLDK